jgi:hypothetical protein
MLLSEFIKVLDRLILEHTNYKCTDAVFAAIEFDLENKTCEMGFDT